MTRRALALLVLGCAVLTAGAGGVDPRARTISSSKQFIIYSADSALRGRVATSLEEVKADTLRLLGEPDRAKIPIVVTLQMAATPSAVPRPVALTMTETPQGPKIGIDVQIGDDPSAVHLQKHALRALLLELAYRDRTVHGGEAYIEPPWWLVAGALESFRRRDVGVDADLFQRLLDTNRLPPIERFLTQHEEGLGGTADAMDGACAMAILEGLIEQPSGRDGLARLVRQWPDLHGDPISALTRCFPALANGDVQKWWTLNLARYAASDRYKGLSIEETDRELNALLEIELVVDKAGTKQSFHIGEFETFRKLPAARAALAARHRGLLDLNARANAIFRPVVSGYEQVLASLSRGRTRRVREQMVQIELYRDTVLHRMGEIANYLNWYEATQLGTRSDAFDGFPRAAHEIEQDKSKSVTDTAIGKYLDELEKEF